MSRAAVRYLAPLLAAVLLLLAAGCGGSSPGSAGAAFAPAGAELFLSVDTDFDSAQWQRAGDLLERFPDGDRLVAFLLSELAAEGVEFDRDVRPAFGPEVGIVALDLAGEEALVGFTQPQDAQKLEQLLGRAEEDIVTRAVGDWTVFAEDERTLDDFEAARAEGSLAEEDEFKEVMSGVAEDALAHLYVSGEGLGHGLDLPAGALESFFPAGEASPLAAALAVEEEGVRIESAFQVADGFLGDPYEARLPDEVPAGVLFYASFRDLERPLSRLRDTLAALEPELERDLARLEAVVGVSLEEDVFPLLAGEGALYARGGGFLPEITLLLEVDDEQAARDTLARLVAALQEELPLGPPRETEIAGVDAVEIPLGVAPVALYYATFEGRLAVTSSRQALVDLLEGGERLGEEEGFQAALEAAGVPDESLGFLYVDVAEVASLVFGFVGAFAPTEETDLFRRNVEPLQHAVVHGERDGDLVRLRAFLAIE